MYDVFETITSYIVMVIRFLIILLMDHPDVHSY